MKTAMFFAEEGIVMPNCEDCWNYNYDQDTEEYYCFQDIDEDEWYRIHTHHNGHCPFFRQADDYYTARRQ